MSPERLIDSMPLFLSGCNGSAACRAGRAAPLSAAEGKLSSPVLILLKFMAAGSRSYYCLFKLP